MLWSTGGRTDSSRGRRLKLRGLGSAHDQGLASGASEILPAGAFFPEVPVKENLMLVGYIVPATRSRVSRDGHYGEGHEKSIAGKGEIELALQTDRRNSHH